MTKVKKTLFSSAEVMERFREEAEKVIRQNRAATDEVVQGQDIEELVHQIQVQQVELEMQNDELRISNEELESQRQKFAGLYDLAPISYFILDTGGIIEEVNTTGLTLLDTHKGFVINRRFQKFISPADNDLFYLFLRRTISTKTRQSCQLTLLNARSKIIYAQVEGIAIRNNSTHKDQCFIAVIDLTERKMAELTLRETKERLEMALDASAAGTFHVDITGGKILFDDYCYTMYGLSERSFDGRIDTYINIIHPDDQKMVRRAFMEAISSKRDLDVEYRVNKSGDKITYVSARGHVMENDRGQLSFIGIMLDVTSAREMEEEAVKFKLNQQKNIMAAILQTQENERKRISAALHDSVSQLLYGIKLKLQRLKKAELAEDGAFADVYNLIDLAIKETRNISFEIAPSILTDFGLKITLNEMAKRLNSDLFTISVRVSDFKFRLSPEVETSVFRIIQELLNNAIKHSSASKVIIELSEKGQDLFICVRDNGIGFNLEDLSKHSGGSGLQSIKNRLSLLNGELDIQSDRRTGTQAKIILKDIKRK